MTTTTKPSGARRRILRLPRPSRFDLLTLAVSLTVLVIVVYPLGSMLRFVLSDVSLADWRELFGQSWFAGMIFDTVTVVGLAVVMAVAGAIFLAWVNERTDAGLGPIGDVVPLIPLFLPTVAVAIGWVLLGNPDVGFINGFFDATLGALGVNFDLNIYTRLGVAFVIAIICLPYAYLPIATGFKTIDPALEEAARVSGAGPARVLWTVAIPAIRPAIQAAIMLVLIVGLSQYSVPEVIGTPADLDVMSVRVIRSIRATYPPDHQTSVMLSMLLFAVLATLWVLQRNVLKSGLFSRMAGREQASSVVRLGPLRWPVRLCVFLYVFVAVVLPFLALLVVSFQAFWQPRILESSWTTKHYTTLWEYPIARLAVENSVILGLLVGLTIVLFAAIIMYHANRRSNMASSFADAVVKLPAALPNLIVAIALILAVGGPPFNLGGTLLILGLGFLVVTIPYAAIASESSFAAIHPSLREASYMCGGGEGVTFRRIVGPLVVPGLCAAWALVFVHILGDLVIAVLLGTGSTPVIGFLLLDTWQQGLWGQVASLALIMTAVTAPIVLLMLLFGRPRYRRAAKVGRTQPASDATR